MTSIKDGDKSVRVTEVQDEEPIWAAIWKTLDGIESKIVLSVEKIDNDFRHLNKEIDEGNNRFTGQVKEIFENLNDLREIRKSPKSSPFQPFKLSRPRLRSDIESSEEFVDVKEGKKVENQRKAIGADKADTNENIDYMWRMDYQRNVKLLKDKIDQIMKTAYDKFDKLMADLQKTREKAQRFGRQHDELEEEVQKRRDEHEAYVSYV